MKNIKITISEDKLTAAISIAEDEENFPTADEVNESIRKAGVIYGINREIIAKIVSERRSVTEVTFAHGKPPVMGENAKLVWYLNLISSSKPVITAQGKADFKQIKQLVIVKKNQNIVSKLPLTNGIDGKNVIGETIYAAGKDIVLPSGKGTGISDDGLTLFSQIDGYVFIKEGKVNVDNVYHIKGNVDFKTGNVKFNGKILIDGDVRSGFRVEATDSIFIKGNVGAADIYSKKGDIVVQLGILGKGRAKILASGELRSGFIQDATVSVQKDVVVNHYLINSNTFSGGKVVLLHNEGLIRGGKTFGERGIEAREVGSKNNISTEIGIGGDNHCESGLKESDIKEIKALKSRLLLADKRLLFLNLLRERVTSFSLEKEKELKNIEEEINNLKLQIKKIEDTKTEPKIIKNSHAQKKSIKVMDTLHKGVAIAIGHAQYYTENTFQGVEIYIKDEDILIEKMPETRGQIE
jgi:hypothetical protein